MKRIILTSALSLCLATAGPAQAQPNWPAAPYSFYAKNDSLQTVLREFAGGFSLSLQMNPGLGGTVNGRFNANTPTEFMDKLGGVYGFNWFVYAGTLFVSRASDMATRSISSSGNSISSLRDALLQMGILDPRFGWGELPDQGIALVSGPPAYVDLVQRTVKALPMGVGGQQVEVFRLKNASVDDRTVSYRDQTVIQPGVATVLRNLITGSSSGNNNQVLSAIAAPLRENPPSFAGQSSDANASAAQNGAANGQNGGSDNLRRGTGLRLNQPSVQADSRQNAIIVQDVPDRMPIYRRLIEELDQPSTLVQIEAMIVDVDSSLVNQLGVNWGARAGTTSLGYTDLTLTPSGGLPLDSTATVTPGMLGVSLGNRLVARLNALQSNGQANILSQPSILTVDNLGAIIDLSQTFYIQTIGERVATVTPVTVGTSLRVTPRYIDDNGQQKVELTVDIEDGTVNQTVMVGSLPTVNKSTVSTLAVVGNDQTLLIGGYNHAEDSSQTDKVPILGNIPLLGVLFSNRGKTVKRQERLFLLRPKVVAVKGRTVAIPRGQEIDGHAMNATWGHDDRRFAAGQSLDLVRGQQTRVQSGAVESGGEGPFTVSPDYVSPANFSR